MITCTECSKTFEGDKAEANLSRHVKQAHKKDKISVKIVSLPMDNFEYNEKLGIYEGAEFNLPGFIVAGILKPNYRSMNGVNTMCVDVILTRK